MKIQLSDFVIKPCTPKCLDDIIRIQSETLSELPSSDILRENTPEMLEECLNPPHFTIGAWYEGKLAAINILFYPHDDKENLSLSLEGLDISGLVTANNKLCIVRKEYRGNGLQYNLGLIIERHAISKGTNLICATVSPYNQYSINNILRLGYVYNKTLIKYGFERNLYYKFI